MFFSAVTYIINRALIKFIQYRTPLEMFHGHKLDYKRLRVFGCLWYPFIRTYNRHKLQYRSAALTFLGYSSQHKGYKVLLPNDKIIISRHVLFDENMFLFVVPTSVGSKFKTNSSYSFHPYYIYMHPITHPITHSPGSSHINNNINKSNQHIKSQHHVHYTPHHSTSTHEPKIMVVILLFY